LAADVTAKAKIRFPWVHSALNARYNERQAQKHHVQANRADGVIPASSPLTVRDMSGAVRQPAIRTLGFDEFRRLLAPPAERSRDTRVEFFDDGKIARLLVPSLLYGPDQKKTEEVFDQAFDQIRRRASTDLIIDIRGNGGGDSRMGDYVLRFVRPKQSAKPESFFTGKTFLLTDHLVFSSAVMFADAFRDYRVGTAVGYETGGTPSHYGYPRSFALKNSGIDFGVSSKHFNAPKPRPGDDEHGVLPDVAVNRELLVPFRKETDPMLAFALAYIRKSRENPPR
jgi:C-terminal processing protease CtpA/Prc